MKKMLIFSVVFISFFSCKKEDPISPKHLSGYWEIAQVELSNGTIKKFKINETIDYIELTDSINGFRKKMKPTFIGTYETSKDLKPFKIKKGNDSLILHYHSKNVNYTETVIAASEKKLKIVSKNNTIYTYKRYIPINVE